MRYIVFIMSIHHKSLYVQLYLNFKWEFLIYLITVLAYYHMKILISVQNFDQIIFLSSRCPFSLIIFHQKVCMSLSNIINLVCCLIWKPYSLVFILLFTGSDRIGTTTPMISDVANYTCKDTGSNLAHTMELYIYCTIIY